MIEIIPSISIFLGKCVKVHPGDFEHPVVYNHDPLEVAQELEATGLKRLSIIDLDGAKAGELVNYNILEMLARYTELAIDFSGGIVTEDDVRTAFECGAKHIGAATVAAQNPDLFASWVVTYGREKIILIADSVAGKVITGAWTKKTEIDLLQHIDFFYERGIKYIKCTDVAKDGELQGPPLDLYKQILTNYPQISLIASGGVSSIEDILNLQEIGVQSVMFSTAYYEGKINLKELQQIIEN